MRELKEIVVHCSATPTGTVDSIRNYHINHNGWSDIGYHYVIERDGALKTGRPLEQIGAHVKGANADTIGICLVGDTWFTDMQFNTLQSIINRLVCSYPSIVNIKPHNWYPSAKQQGKTCPNFDLKQHLQSPEPEKVQVY